MPLWAVQLLIVNTSYDTQYAYAFLKHVAYKAGFSRVNIVPLHQVNDATIAQVGVMVIPFDVDLFDARASLVPSLLVKQLQRLIEKVQKNKESVLIFALASKGQQRPFFAMNKGYVCMEQVIMESLFHTDKATRAVTPRIIQHFFAPYEYKNYRYHTALNIPTKGWYQGLFKKNIEKTLWHYLPISTSHVHTHLLPWYPLMMHVSFEQAADIVLTGLDYMHLGDVKENAFLMPDDPSLYQRLEADMIHCLRTLLTCAQHKKKLRTVIDVQKKYGKSTRNVANAFLKAVKNRNEKPIICLWASLHDFFKKDTAQLKRGAIERLASSGCTMLWLELCPERYLTQASKEKELFYARVRAFNGSLAAHMHNKELPLPHIFIGVTVSGTVAAGIGQHNYAQDMYGKVYKGVSAPFAWDAYWYPQLVVPLQQFLHDWRTDIGCGNQVSGIMFDMEMYAARELTQLYPAIGDFSDHTWQAYVDQYLQRNKRAFIPMEKDGVMRMNYLLQTNTFFTYQQFLERNAYTVGKKIAHALRKKDPSLTYGVYLPSLTTEWFYTAFCAGLSTQKKPLLCATFNRHWVEHRQWYLRQKIFLKHLSVAMLSKFKTVPDFTRIDALLKYHDGIWFNRYSTIEQETMENPIDYLEYSPLKKNFAYYLGNKLANKTF